MSSTIAVIWANQIIENKKTFDQVPRLLKEQVATVLVNSGHSELVSLTI